MFGLRFTVFFVHVDFILNKREFKDAIHLRYDGN